MQRSKLIAKLGLVVLASLSLAPTSRAETKPVPVNTSPAAPTTVETVPLINPPRLSEIPRAVSDTPAPLSMRAAPSPNQAVATEGPVIGKKTREVMQQGVPVDLRKLAEWRGTDGKAERFITYVLRDREEWEDFWLNQGRSPPDALPRHRMAVAIMLGPRATQGYYVRIVSINDLGGGNYNVHYEELRPGQMSAAAEGRSSPWVVKLLPRTEGRVRFFPVVRD